MREGRGRLHVRPGFGASSHRVEVFSALPLRIVDNLGSVEALVDAGRDEAGQAFHGVLSCINEHIHEFLLLVAFNGEDVGQCDDAAAFRDVAIETSMSDEPGSGLDLFSRIPP